MFIVVVKAMVKKQNKVLFLQRSENSYDEGKWDFPGGKLEEKEKPQDALIREVFEETGITCKVIGPMDIVSSYVEEKDKSYIIIIYECKYLDGNITLNQEHKQWQWVDESQIQCLDLTRYLREIYIEKNKIDLT